MKLRILTVLTLWFSFSTFLSMAQTHAKPVMVYYMPWYVAKPMADEWGWHWTMNHFDPDKTNASGEREIASWYYPLIGPYDSSDPAVLEYHVLLMKLAGIDGVVVDWYGSTDYFDYAKVNHNTAKLFEYTRKAGLKFAICYEDQTIQHLIDGQKLTKTDAIRHAQKEMLFLQTNFFCDPTYLRIDGRPLLENFGPQYFLSSTNWDQVFSALDASNRPAFFSEDNRLECGIGAFDWPPMWLSQQPGTGGVLSEALLKNYLVEFEKKSTAWPAFISSAFPRFHDIYQRAGARNYWGYLGDRNGETLRETFGRALTNNSVLIQVVTWNDFGEGTTIEPTREYGFRDLGLIRDLIRRDANRPGSMHTNDLSLALRFYKLRRASSNNSVGMAALDQIFTNFVSGRQEDAASELQKLEATLRQTASGLN
ncbi:MAG TPA: glycoside hydrolase family 71/99-like protein [Verrucomicrobiae bacterium]|nr:glycoside hydrolase family 71/99-like protein [Verrucomicrobiae bacterium]